MMSTSTKPWSAFSRRRSMRSAYISLMSAHVVTLTPAGSSSAARAAYSFTAAATSSGVSLPTRKALTMTARWPLKRTSRSSSENPSRMVAMSRSISCVPSGRANTAMSPNSFPRSRRSVVRSRISPAVVRTVPAGSSREAALTRLAMSSMVRPY
jgi:hypothetical protein